MSRLLLILILVCALPMRVDAQRKRAFMVGISDYRSYGYRVWNNIHGAEDVALLRPELEKKGFRVTALTNAQATHRAIVSALASFIAGCRRGDVVYMHFSCHGQPVEDGLKSGYPSHDEADLWDESIVPVDAGNAYDVKGYRGEKHITDDELRQHILRLRRKIGKQGILIVVVEACHAGNMERDDFETVRGTNEGLVRNPQRKYNPKKGVVKRSRPQRSPLLSPVVFAEACESFQRNQEITYNMKEYGALSFNVWQMLRQSAAFPKDVTDFKSRLSTNILQNTRLRNRLWPATQTVVFEYCE